MALNKTTLASSIANAFASAHGQGLQSEDTALANSIADAIDTYVKGGDVNPTSMIDAEARPITGTGDIT